MIIPSSPAGDGQIADIKTLQPRPRTRRVRRAKPAAHNLIHIPGIEMFGNSIPAETVGGDLFAYINFQQRYDIDARIHQAEHISI